VIRSACGLLAAMHVAPLVRVSSQLLHGPTPALVATWAVLALLIGVLAAKAAGLAILPRHRFPLRRAPLIAFITAAAVFHGDVIISSKDHAPTTVAVLVTTGAAAAAVPLLRRVREQLTGSGASYKQLFPALLWGRAAREHAPRPLSLVGLSAAVPRGPPCSPVFQA
jgi:hypothetical protein